MVGPIIASFEKLPGKIALPKQGLEDQTDHSFMEKNIQNLSATPKWSIKGGLTNLGHGFKNDLNVIWSP
jgi:hypothetical protein